MREQQQFAISPGPHCANWSLPIQIFYECRHTGKGARLFGFHGVIDDWMPELTSTGVGDSGGSGWIRAEHQSSTAFELWRLPAKVSARREGNDKMIAAVEEIPNLGTVADCGNGHQSYTLFAISSVSGPSGLAQLVPNQRRFPGNQCGPAAGVRSLPRLPTGRQFRSSVPVSLSSWPVHVISDLLWPSWAAAPERLLSRSHRWPLRFRGSNGTAQAAPRQLYTFASASRA